MRLRTRAAAVDLCWIPLGAGGHYVRFNGRVFEAIAAALQRRQRRDLYHVALTVELDGDRYAIELAPSPDADEASRGVVATGALLDFGPGRGTLVPRSTSSASAALTRSASSDGRVHR